ncbi:MAG TPA: ABC transporter permease [Planctomycetota bacterium]|nr:ABC transporter permease [Planctomycetota bacterium]
MQQRLRDGLRACWRAVADYVGLAGVLAGLIVLFGLTARNFLTLDVFRTIANQIPYTIVLAVGMTYVLIIAGIDLSVGSVLALSVAVMAQVLTSVKGPLALPLGVVACLATGLVCGAINGAVTVAWRLPAFIVTLGMLEMARGAAYFATAKRTLYFESRVSALSEVFLGGLSLSFYVALAIVALAQFVLTRSVLGRYMVAIGTNEEAVRLSGIRPRPVKFAVFALCGLLTGLAAVMHALKSPSANPGIGQGYELDAIAAAVIGGTSLMGGRGSVVGSFFGVLIMAVLWFGLAGLGVAEEYKRFVTGLAIVAAAIAEYYRRRMARAERA